MGIVVALSLLAALCTVEAIPASSTDLEILRLRVREMKWNVETVIRQLQLLRSQTEDDTLREVSLKWNEEQDSYRTYETLLLSGIRKEINAAKAEGKDVDSCLNNAVDSIKANLELTNNEAARCETAAQNSIHNNLGFLDYLISTADTISLELDNIFLNCHDSDINRMQTCIIGELAKTENSLKILESDSITAEITIVPVSKNVIKQASNCLKQAYSITYTAGAATRMAVTQCILTSTTPTSSEKPSEESSEEPSEEPSEESSEEPSEDSSKKPKKESSLDSF